MTYRTIVVGTDGSDSANRAVDEAIELASASGARLVVVTAFERQDGRGPASAPEDIRWRLTDANEAESHARRGRERAHAAGASDVVVQALDGEAADKLLEAAEDFDADLIVVGSVGLTGGARFVLGSVASGVLHHAPCDVLVAHTHG